MNMKKTSSIWDEARENGKLILEVRVWELAEKIHFRKGTVQEHWGSDEITHNALVWLSEGLSHLTSEDLHALYWLLLPTEIISQTLKEAISISRLLSNLYAINSEKLSNTSVSQNFKSVEQFIFTLSSGGYPREYFYKNAKLECLPKSGQGVLFI